MTRHTATAIGAFVCIVMRTVPCIAQAEPGSAGTAVSEEVRVEGVRGGLREDDSRAAIKSDVPLRELPVSVEVLEGELLRSAQFNSLADTLTSYSLAGASPGDGGLSEIMVLRGYSDTPFYRDGISEVAGTLPVRDLANVASVEILKGPNSAIYGPGEPGGSINIETKKPQWDALHTAAVALDSEDRYRVDLDSTGAVAPASSLAYRLVGAVEDAGSFRDEVTRHRYFGAPSLAWQPDPRVLLRAAFEFARYEAPYDSGVVAVDGELPLPDGRFLGEPGLGPVRLDALTATLTGEVQLGETWSLSSTLFWQDNDVRGRRVEPSELTARTGMLSRELFDESVYADNLTAQLELQGEYDAWGREHRLLAGYEYSRLRETARLFGSDSDQDPFAIDIFDIDYGQPLPAVAPLRASRERIDGHGLYVQDFIRFGDHWRLLAGTRLDLVRADGLDRVLGTDFEQHDEEFSSRVGLVYTPHTALSLFASYSESLDPNEGLQQTGEPLLPTRGHALEGGARLRLEPLVLILDISGYYIRQTNVTTEDPAAPGFDIQTARQLSRGFDLDLSAAPQPWLRLGIKYGFNDAELRDDAVIPDGTAPLNAPRHKLVMMALITAGLVREEDLRAGFNVITMSSRQASLEAGEFDQRLPGYTIANLFVDFDLSANVTLGIDARNVFNKSYIAGTQTDVLHLTPGAPRTVMGFVRMAY